MTSAALPIALFAVETLITESPALFQQFQKMIAEKGVTAEQLAAKRLAISQQKFEDLVPNSQLPPDVG